MYLSRHLWRKRSGVSLNRHLKRSRVLLFKTRFFCNFVAHLSLFCVLQVQGDRLAQVAHRLFHIISRTRHSRLRAFGDITFPSK